MRKERGLIPLLSSAGRRSFLAHLAVLILASLCGTTSACVRAPAPARAHAGGERSTDARAPWEPAVTISGRPPDRTLRWPSLTTHAGGLVLAATTMPFDDTTALGTRPLVIVRLPGERLPLPTGSYTFAYPRVVTDSADDLHLFWGEPADVDSAAGRTARTWPGALAVVMHSVFRGGRWSTPEALVEATRVGWMNADVRPDTRGRIHVVVHAFRPRGSELIHASQSGEGWSRSTLAQPAVYPVLNVDDDSSVLGYIATRADDPGQANSIYLRASSDGGRSWSEQARAAASNGADFSNLHLVRGRDAVYLYALQRAGTSTWVRRFRQTGRTAVPAGATSPDSSFMVSRLATAASPCGDPLVIAETIDPGGRPVLREIRIEAGALAWREVVPAFSASGSPAITLDSNDTYHMVFVGLRPGGGRATTLVTQRPACGGSGA